jgi:hypothetical protein
LKQILYTTQNVLTRDADLAGYAFLQCMASYLQYHMYITLDVHTESTLAAGEAELLVFQDHLEVSILIQNDLFMLA